MRQGWQLVQWQLAEVVHQRIAWMLAAVALALVLSLGSLRVLNFGGDEARFFVSVAQFILTGCGSLLAAIVAPTLFARGVTSQVLPMFFARGVGRATWVGASLIALWIALAWLLLVVAGALFALLAWQGHAQAIREAGRALALDFCGLLTVAAAATYFAVVFERVTAAASATVALAFAGHAGGVVTYFAARESGLAGLAWTLIDWVVPNFADSATVGAVAMLGGAAGYSLVFLGATMWFFSRREL